AGDVTMRGGERQREQASREHFRGGDALGGRQRPAAFTHDAPQAAALGGHREGIASGMAVIVAAAALARKGAAAGSSGAASADGKYVLRHADACGTTLNPRFRWGRQDSIGLPAA